MAFLGGVVVVVVVGTEGAEVAVGIGAFVAGPVVVAGGACLVVVLVEVPTVEFDTKGSPRRVA